MHNGSTGLALLACGLTLSGGCAGADSAGHYWAITATGVSDSCTGEAANTRQEFEYRVVYDGTEIEVAVGEDVFASGVANGCQIAYESITWTDERNGYDVAWRIVGNAVAQQGGNACSTASDWAGTEVFEVVTSEDPEIAPGCSYEMSLQGTYLEEVK